MSTKTKTVKQKKPTERELLNQILLEQRELMKKITIMENNKYVVFQDRYIKDTDYWWQPPYPQYKPKILPDEFPKVYCGAQTTKTNI